jgi:hypothetical protein
MKKYILFFLLVPPFLIMAQQRGCDLTIFPSQGEIDGHGNAANIGPGDTICLEPGARSFLWIKYLHGSKEQPIVIQNVTGGVDVSNFYYGIKIDSCSYLKLSGKGVSFINYGIRIHDISGGGLSVEGLSTDIEIEGLEISGTVFVGIFAKSDPDCLFNSTRDKYVLRNLSIHDNYIHNVGMEGFYIGSSFYSGKVINCNGKDTLVYPHLLKGVKVYNNLIEHSGWDGIQVACADSGCAIYNNVVKYDSDSAEYNQMSGILIGGGSQCDCYNNTILDGKGVGINMFGLGDEKIYNNLIVRPGRTFPDEYPLMSGIYVGDEVTLAGKGYLIAYNTIISPKVFGIHYSNPSTSGSLLTNNIIADPGNTYFEGTNFQAVNNLSEAQVSSLLFVDPTTYNYDLNPTSPAVNQAVTVPQLNLQFDILDRLRPFAQINDIGAYECQLLPGIPEQKLQGPITFSLKPSTEEDHINLIFTLMMDAQVTITLYNLQGTSLDTILSDHFSPGNYEKSVDIRNLSTGVYVFHLTTNEETISIKYHIF